jgi:hypothetical protein
MIFRAGFPVTLPRLPASMGMFTQYFSREPGSGWQEIDAEEFAFIVTEMEIRPGSYEGWRLAIRIPF